MLDKYYELGCSYCSYIYDVFSKIYHSNDPIVLMDTKSTDIELMFPKTPIPITNIKFIGSSKLDIGAFMSPKLCAALEKIDWKNGTNISRFRSFFNWLKSTQFNGKEYQIIQYDSHRIRLISAYPGSDQNISYNLNLH